MRRLVRYTLSPDCPSTASDHNPDVKQGELKAMPENARLLPPCSPTKIVCVGRNYVDHAKELGNPVPAEPLIFLKPVSSLIGHGESIVYPAISQNVNFEGELGGIIGKRARHIARENAFDYIAGYTCLNDVTARDIQRKDVQFTRGKGFDTFCAVGPHMVPAADVDLSKLRVLTRLDGEVKQDGPVTDMIFPVDAIIAFVTACMTLEPGDLIATGTPAGVGPMLPGQTVEVEIPGIGILQNPVIQG
jgi:2-keto-4-pentenoate hydratase/2-oxohepta-3-ene-1,7-dioic acid hydratase in catechol pathway